MLKNPLAEIALKNRRAGMSYKRFCLARNTFPARRSATLKLGAPSLVEEVSDHIPALKESQRPSDRSEEAISVLAVARVVVGKCWAPQRS